MKFLMGLRADDTPILAELVEATGLGALKLRTTGRKGNAAPIMQWQVATQEECLQIVELFDRYPLRTKKARDFAVWREAAICYAVGGAPFIQRDWTYMEELFHEIRNVRRYDPELVTS